MMKRIAILFMVLFVAIAALAQAALPQFSADMSIKSAKRGGETTTGKYYMGKRKMRMDMNSQGHQVSNITDLEAKKSYMVMVSQKMYMEHDLNSAGPMGQRVPKIDIVEDPNHPCDPDHYTCNKVGSEMMNGRMTDKWEYKALDKGNEAENKTVWVDQKLHFPVRTVMGDGTETNFTNIKEGAQDETMFHPPAGFQKMDMGGMMGMGGRGRKE